MKDFINRTTLVLEIADGSHEAVVKFKTKNGGITTKTVSVSDFLMELSQDMEITTGILPSGTKFYAGTKNSYLIGVQVPAKVRTAEFRLDNGLCTMTVPFPEILFIFMVREGQIIDSKLFACIPPIGRSYDRLYRFPFGNVYDTGVICWGGIVLPKINEPIVFDGVIGRFFTCVFSGHLVYGTNMFNPLEGVVNLRTLLEHLVGQEHFPDHILKQSNITLGMVMSRHK
jgi:hypothetical protein